MKKTLSLLFLILLLSDQVIVEGQTKSLRHPPAKLGYGLKGGINIAWQSSPDNNSSVLIKEILSVNAGGYINYFYTRKFAIQGELVVSGKGLNWKGSFDQHMKDVATYVDITGLAKYQFHKYLNIHAGPVLSYRLNATRKDLNENVVSEIRDLYESVEVSATAGVELTLPIRINVTLRYLRGFTPATKDQIGSWYDNLVQFSVCYRFAGR